MGAVGKVAGGVYVAERLGAAAGVKVPHADAELQSTPPAVSVQDSPAFVKSFVMDAFMTAAPPPTAAEGNGLVIVTEIGGVASVKLKLSIFDESAMDVADIVGDRLAPVGGVAGGVYWAVSAGAAPATSVPQAGEQFVPPAVSAQARPALVTSFVTVAARFAVGPPIVWEENLVVIVTPIGGNI